MYIILNTQLVIIVCPVFLVNEDKRKEVICK